MGRTKIDLESKYVLEAAYQVDPKPSGHKIVALSKKIKMDRDVVRVWFANRRQKSKKQRSEVHPHYITHASGILQNMFTSPQHENIQSFDQQHGLFDQSTNVLPTYSVSDSLEHTKTSVIVENRE